MAKKDTSLDDIADAINVLATNIDARFEQVDVRFEQIDSHFKSIDHQLYEIRHEQRVMREWLERVESRVIGIESDIKEIYDRLVILEEKYPNVTANEMKELEHKLDMMIKWAQKISKKTGVPLPKM